MVVVVSRGQTIVMFVGLVSRWLRLSDEQIRGGGDEMEGKGEWK